MSGFFPIVRLAAAALCALAGAVYAEEVSCAAALAEIGDEAVIVDVRPAAEFAEVSVAGAHNMPLFAVKTKTFWRERNLLLVGRAGSEQELEQECERLRKLGFAKVQYLPGGLGAWRSAGRALAGDPRAIGESRAAPPLRHEEHEPKSCR